jgi:hypothetical protein
MNKNKYKGLKIAFIVALIGVVLVFVFDSDKKVLDYVPNYTTNRYTKPLEETEEPKQRVLTEEEKATAITAGALLSQKSESEMQRDEQFAKLRHSTPIETDDFTISKFSFKTMKFNILFKTGNTDNKKIFIEWLKANGYGDVDTNYFQYTN